MQELSAQPIGSTPDQDLSRVHGGMQDAELRALDLRPEQVLDFSSSTNPYGPHPRMIEALQKAAIERYPDSSALGAREALSAQLGVSVDRLVLGNGAADLLWNLARCLLDRGRRALCVTPTFSEFSAAAQACGAELNEWRSRPERAFDVDLDAVAERAQAGAVRLVYLCSPNTPTGSALPAEELRAWARSHPELEIILDQSFLSLSERFEDARVAMPRNVTSVRSLTKDHGIPGVRVGYLIGSPELCEEIEANRPAWTTSAFAQAAAIASTECSDFVRDSRERLLSDRRELAIELGSIGIETFPSRTTFLLCRMPQVTSLRARLLAKHQILVRDCASFGLPGFMRLGAKPKAARQRLLDALRAEAVGC